MNRIPFKTIGVCSAILTVLIIARCLVTIGRVRYYGDFYWLTAIQEDPWLYVSVASSALSALCFLLAYYREQSQLRKQAETEAQAEEDF